MLWRFAKLSALDELDARQNRGPAGGIERLHVLRLVCASAGHEGKAVVHRSRRELGHAFFEYLLQVPANRIGSSAHSLPQLKIIQEVITLTVFVPFVLLYMKQPLKWDYLWAGLCLCGAVYFVFRK